MKDININNDGDVIGNEVFYIGLINKSKEILEFKVITEKYKDELKERIFSCIDTCSRSNFDNNVTIDKILGLIEDEKFISNLDNLGKSKLYSSLGDNYFLLGDMESCLENYEISYKLGNKNIYKEIIYMKIFLLLPFEDNKLFNEGRSGFVSIFNDLDNTKNDIDFGDEIELDLEDFFVGGKDFIKEPNTLQGYIYNLEVTEDKWLRYIQDMDFHDEKEYKKVILKTEEILSNQYMQIAEASNHLDYVYEAYGNMLKRLGGQDIDYYQYGKNLRDFLDTGFDMVDIYIENDEFDKVFSIINFISINGFKNLNYVQKDYIVLKLSKLFNGRIEGYDDDKLNEILLNAANEGSISYKSMVDLGDMFLKLKRYGNAYSFYYFGKKGNIDINSNLKELLELMLLGDSFSEDIISDEVMKPELIITLLLEKLNNNKILDMSDETNIKYLCNL